MFHFAAAAFDKYKPSWGHQTSFIVVVGIIWSVVLYAIHPNNPYLIDSYGFRTNLFFQAMLPPLIFNSGFSMRRKKFFENIGNIVIFGLCVTLVCFILYSLASYGLMKGLNI